MSYEYQPYPKVLYHATEDPRVVQAGEPWPDGYQETPVEALASGEAVQDKPKRGRPAKRTETPADPAVE